LKILYITFIDMDQLPTSGSSVRPQRMLKAFEELGCEVKLLSGICNNRQKRMAGTREIRQWLKSNRPDLCYIEPPSGPLFFHCDRSLIRLVKKMNIPIGLFYRDAYWKFPEFEEGSGEKNLKDRCKTWLIRRMQIGDKSLFDKCCTMIYFPSATMQAHFSFHQMKPLPPGCFESTQQRRVVPEGEISTGIYVGGATIRYGVRLILDAARIVNRDKVRFRLIYVCAESGWKAFLNEYPQYRDIEKEPWLTMKHLNSGPELETLYQQSDFGMMPLTRNLYHDFAMPIKLFEYTSRLLPVLTTDCVETAAFIKKYGNGIVCQDNPDDFAQGVEIMLEQLSKGRFHDECFCAREDNLWTKRAQQIMEDLLPEKEKPCNRT
jgi:glycosyltransferase involved in cell wall biosynthesis